MEEKVIGILKDVLEIDEVSMNISQDNCENWNSLRHLNLVSDLEDEFDVELEPEEIAEMKSVKDIISIIQQKLKKE